MARPELLSQTTQKLRVFRIIGPGMKELLLLIRKSANLTTRLICLGRKVSQMQELSTSGNLNVEVVQLLHLGKQLHAIITRCSLIV